MCEYYYSSEERDGEHCACDDGKAEIDVGNSELALGWDRCRSGGRRRRDGVGRLLGGDGDWGLGGFAIVSVLQFGRALAVGWLQRLCGLEDDTLHLAAKAMLEVIETVLDLANSFLNDGFLILNGVEVMGAHYHFLGCSRMHS